jgi:hypothetical protein
LMIGIDAGANAVHPPPMADDGWTGPGGAGAVPEAAVLDHEVVQVLAPRALAGVGSPCAHILEAAPIKAFVSCPRRPRVTTPCKRLG